MDGMYEKKISIIIVSYNAKDLLEKCINSIEKYVKINHEVIIVDNASKSETTDYLKTQENRCKIIFNKRNVGFSRANNIGVMRSNGEFIHFLNPDTQVDKTINDLYQTIFKKGRGTVYATVLNENGHKVSGGHILPVFSNIYNLILGRNLARWYLGASLIFHKDDFLKIGKWDESYFMYSEDLDLCYKVHKCNLKLEELDSNIVHMGGGTTRKWSNYEKDLKKEKAYIFFFKKHKIFFNYFAFSFISLFYNFFIHGEMNFFYRMKIILNALYKNET